MFKVLYSYAAMNAALGTALFVGCGQQPTVEPAPSKVAKSRSNDKPSGESSKNTEPQNGQPSEETEPKQESNKEPKVSQQLRNELSKHSVFIEWSNDGWVISTSYAQDQSSALQVAAKLKPWAAIEIGEDATDEHIQLLAEQATLQIVSASLNKAITDDGIALLASLTELRELDLYHAELVTGKGVASLAPLTNLESLKISGIELEDDAKVLANFEQLRVLHLDDCGITDGELAPLAQLTQLEELVLANNQLNGTGLKHVGKLNLTVLQLQDNETVENEPLDFDTYGNHLQSQTELEVLDLSRANLTDVGLKHLADMQSLRQLNVSHAEIEGTGLVHLANCENLEVIELHNKAFNGVGLKHLAKCSKLKALNLSWTGVGDDALEEVSALQQLTKLDLPPYGDNGIGKFWQASHNEHLTDKGLADVAKLKNLEWFWVGGGGVTDAGMQELAVLENLSHLGLGNLPNVQGACLQELSRLNKIDHLRLTDTGMTDENLKHLAKFRNLRTVHLPIDATDAALEPLYELNKLQFLFVGDNISKEAIEKLTNAKTALKVNRY